VATPWSHHAGKRQVWGGTTEEERQQLRRRARRAASVRQRRANSVRIPGLAGRPEALRVRDQAGRPRTARVGQSVWPACRRAQCHPSLAAASTASLLQRCRCGGRHAPGSGLSTLVCERSTGARRDKWPIGAHCAAASFCKHDTDVSPMPPQQHQSFTDAVLTRASVTIRRPTFGAGPAQVVCTHVWPASAG
jgi:hypothetical protein